MIGVQPSHAANTTTTTTTATTTNTTTATTTKPAVVASKINSKHSGNGHDHPGDVPSDPAIALSHKLALLQANSRKGLRPDPLRSLSTRPASIILYYILLYLFIYLFYLFIYHRPHRHFCFAVNLPCRPLSLRCF